MADPQRMGIGEVAARTGLSVHALRFYEREGVLVDRVPRNPGGRRRFSEDDVAWLQTCVRFRAAGMPLATIRQYARLVQEGPGNEQERLALLSEHEAEVLEQIGRLQDTLGLVRHKLASYRNDLAEGSDSCSWNLNDQPSHC